MLRVWVVIVAAFPPSLSFMLPFAASLLIYFTREGAVVGHSGDTQGWVPHLQVACCQQCHHVWICCLFHTCVSCSWGAVQESSWLVER